MIHYPSGNPSSVSAAPREPPHRPWSLLTSTDYNQTVRRLLIALLGLATLASAQEPPAEKPFVPLNRWALVIGASAYSKDIGPLKYTSKEARDFADQLTGHLGFTNDNIKVLTDGGTLEQTPTSEHILSSLDALLKNPRLDKANLFIFYFSGHGVGTAKGDFLLPSDTTPDKLEEMGVPVKAVIERIVQAGLKNVLFITDACRAGQANDFGGQFVELCRQANLAVILGCEPGKRSYEYPRLKSGAFTHFLIEALGNTSLRDESGTLWASKLGAEVQKQVRDYTEPDYGKFAQVPALWGEQSTLDVLLATYPQKPVSDMAIASFKKTAERLDKKEFAAAMMEYASQLQLADREDQSVEIFKAVDQLGELTPLGRYLYGNALNLVGRTGEATKVFDAFGPEEKGIYKDLALLETESRSVSPTTRVEAATRLLKTDTDFPIKMLSWLTVQQRGNYEQQLKFARQFAQVDGEPRAKLYAKAWLADVEGRWKNSIDLFEQAIKSPGEFPKDKELFLSESHPLSYLGDEQALRAWIGRGLKIKGCEVVCYLQRARLAKENGDDKGRVEALKGLLASNPDAGDIWNAATVAGFYIADLKDEFLKAAEQYPYAWRARMIVAFIKGINGDSTMLNDLNAGALYRDDTLTFGANSCELMGSLLEEGVRLGKVPELAYRHSVELYYLGLLGSVGDFKFDADIWIQFLAYGLLNERNTQIRFLLSKFIPFTPEAAPKALRSSLLLSALNQGDTPTINRLTTAGFDPGEGDDPKWMLAMYLAVTGKEKEASSLITNLKPASGSIAPRAEAMKTYLLAKSGQAAKAKARMKNPIDDFVVRGFNGLAWASLGDWKRAEPLLVEQTKSRNWAFLYVTAKANAILDAHYRIAKRFKDTQAIAYSASASQPSNPLFKSFSFAAKPGIAQFAGTTVMDCVIEDDILCAKSMAADGKKTYGFGKLNIRTMPNGVVVGTVGDAQGNKYPFSGQIDPLGNFKGQANFKDRQFQVGAKFAPPSIYKTFPAFKTTGLVIEFVDTQGYRVDVIGHVG